MLRWKGFAIPYRKTIALTGFNRKWGTSRYRQIASGLSIRTSEDPSDGVSGRTPDGQPQTKSKGPDKCPGLFRRYRGVPRRARRRASRGRAPEPGPAARGAGSRRHQAVLANFSTATVTRAV